MSLVLLGSMVEMAGVAGAVTCTAYEFIGARGSGQSQAAEEFGGMGTEINSEFLALRDYLGSSQIQPYAVQYDAVEIAGLDAAGAFLRIGFLGEYTDSVRGGTDDTIAVIERKHAECPDTRFVLSGYSQGAQAVGDALQRMPPEDLALVVAAGFFGDPYFNAGSWSGRSTFSPDNYGLLGVRGEWPAGLEGKVFSYCHHLEWICNGTHKVHIWGDGDITYRDVPRWDRPAHATPAYDTIAFGGRGDASEAALEIAKVLGYTPPPTLFNGPVDLVFAIDTTGSMGSTLSQVKAQVTDMVGELVELNPDVRVGLVDFKDAPAQSSAYQARVDINLGTNFGGFFDAINGLTATGGGDTPESLYSGVMLALNMDFRPGARKLVIPLTDAPGKDPEPITGYTLGDVVLKALSVDPAIIDPIQIGSSSSTATFLQALSNGTSGTYQQINALTTNSFVQLVLEAATDGSSVPNAAISVSELSYVGNTVRMSAAGSTDTFEAIAGYDWDFNGDGVYDATTTTPLTSTVYSSPYAGNVVVRVRGDSGLSALAVATISVVARAVGAPTAPTSFTGASGDGQATLTWTAGAGGLAKWFTIYDGAGAVLDRVGVEAGGAAPSAWIEMGLTNLQSYSYRITAGNEIGESSMVGPIAVVPAPPAPTQDQVVTTNQGTAASGISSSPVTTTAGNELVLAFVSADGPPSFSQRISSVSGGGLTWSLAGRSNTSYGTAEVWQAYATSPLTAAVISATWQQTGYDGSITIATFVGASPTVGATSLGSGASGAPHLALTTTQSNSLVWTAGYNWSHAVAPVPSSGESLVSSFLDTRVGDTTWTQKTGLISAPRTVVNVGDSAPTADRWNLASVEITPVTTGETFGVDKVRTTNQPIGATSLSAPPLSTTHTNQLLIALISTDGPPGTQTISSVAGGGLTWTLVKRANSVYGAAEIWRAYASAPVSNAVITATLQQGSYDGSLTLTSFISANATVGASVGAGATSGAASVSLTTTSAGSLVWGVGHDWDQATARVARSGQTLVNDFVDTRSVNTNWAQATPSPVTSSGTVVTFGEDAPTSGRWNMAAVEIAPAP